MARGARWTRSQSVVDQTTANRARSFMPPECIWPRCERSHAAVAPARRHGRNTQATRGILETELFRGRYHLSSKNDDDLPIVRLIDHEP